jgi:membrane protease YdiL (CAAX protease family)
MDVLVETIRELGADAGVADIVVIGAGIIVFGVWLSKAVFVADPLAESRPRRNNLRLFTPLIPLSMWFVVAPVVAITIGEVPPRNWQEAAINNFILCAGGLMAIGASVILAHRHLARRLKGFGFRPGTALKDAGMGLVNLVAISPVFVAAFVLTLFLARLVLGPDFKMPQHTGLELIGDYPEWPVRVSMIILAVVIAPVSEEMVFRGFIQTLLRTHSGKPWISIAIASGLFAIVHPDWAHWPALFVLAMCIGYAYEKSGSLLRPIFIHAMFNATSVAAVLLGQQ